MASTPYKHFVPPVPINPNYDKNMTFVLIETLEQLKDSFKKGYVIAWDTETTGLNPVESDIVGFSYSYDGVTGYYCPVKHYDLALGKPALDLFYNALKESKLSLLYNARFDIRMMEYSGYDMSFLYEKDSNTNSSTAKFIDVMNQVWLSDSNIPLPSLKSSTLHFLGYQPPKFLETLGDEQNFQYVPSKDAYRYACFTEDTLVQTKHGLKEIKDLIPHKDLIRTSVGYKRLAAVLDQGMHNIIQVITPNGTSFTCTPDHLFAVYTSNGISWIKAENLDKISFFQLYHGGESLNEISIIVDSLPFSAGQSCVIKTLSKKEHVYDLSIEDEHNFFLQCGIIAHNCLDAINTFNLFKVTFKYYKESGLASRLDNSCVYIMGQLEKTPLKIDTDYLVNLRDNVYKRVLDLEKEIYSIAGHPFKIGSNRELTSVFMEQGIDTGERTKAGDMKTNIELLNLYLRNHPDCTLLHLLIEYKEQFKFYNSYLKTLVDIAKQQDTVPPRFSYKLQAVPCLTNNNIVLIKDKGLVSVAEVKENDYIWTQYGYKRVLWCNSHDTDVVYRVFLDTGYFIEGTGHHPVLINKGSSTDIQFEWAVLDNLNKNEHVICNHHTPPLQWENTEISVQLTKYIKYIGYLASFYITPLVQNTQEYIYIKNLENQALDFKRMTDRLLNNIEDLFSFVCLSKPYQWIKFIQGMLYGVFDTSEAQSWNLDLKQGFVIKAKDPIVLSFIMNCLIYLGIISDLYWDEDYANLRIKEEQALTLFKVLIVEDTSSDYLKNLFKDYNPFNYYIEYADSGVRLIEREEGNFTVYDIEVEDVHEYIANGIVTHNTGRLSCLGENTLISTILGDIPIGELSLYEDGNEVFIDHKSTAPFKTLFMGERECVKIILSNKKSLVVTLDHKFLNISAEWVEVKDLYVGDCLLSVNHNELSSVRIINIIPLKGLYPVYTLSVDHPRHQYLSESLISHNCGKDGKNTYFSPINLQCLHKDTLIKTNRGNIPIKDVSETDKVWTGELYAPCKPLGHKYKSTYTIKTFWGEITASLEHRFLVLNQKTWEIEWKTLEDVIQNCYPIVRDSKDLGVSFDEVYDFYSFEYLEDTKYASYHKENVDLYLRKELSLSEYKSLLNKYYGYKFDIVISVSSHIYEETDDKWNEVYDLYVPTYHQFVANGYIVHNSLPKPKSIKCYGRKATQEEIDQRLDTLGWVFSPDHPEWSPGQVVEGMNQKLNVRSAFLPEHPEDGDYVVSIDMCFEAGSPVQTKRGYMGISEMKVGDYIYSPQGWVEVIRVMQTGVKKLIKILPDNGGQALYCTEDHPFIIDGKVVKAKDITMTVPTVKFSSWVQNIQDIKILEDLLCPLKSMSKLKQKVDYINDNGLRDIFIESLNKYTRAKILRMCGICITDTRFLSKFIKITHVNRRPKNDTVWNNIFQYDSTPTSAYLFGYILGDGNISRKREDYPVLNITSKDYAHLVQISNILGDGIRIRYHEKKECKWWTIDIPDRDICSRLIDLGISERKSTTPSNINFDWIGDNFRHFIRGLFDSDGYVRITSVLDFSFVGHDSYITEIKKRIEGDWSYKYTPTLSYLFLLGNLNQRKFIYTYLYMGATIWLQRKRDIIEKWYTEHFGDIVWPVWNCTVNTPEHLIYVQGMNVHQCGEELRVVTNLFREYNWARVINEGGDLHHANSDAIFGKENYTKETRKRAKACAFGMLYGQEAVGFQKKFPEMTMDEAREFIVKFKKVIPSITRGQDRLIKEAQRTGTFYTSFGRPRRVKHYLASHDYKDVAFGKRTCMNGPIQGTAADVLKLELVRLWDNIFTVYPEIKFICTIHDEINYSVPRRLASEVIPKLVRCQTVQMKDWLVPLDCSLSVGNSLGSIYPFKYNFETKEFVPEWEEDVGKKKDEPKQEDSEISESLPVEDIDEGNESNDFPVEEIDPKMFDF